MIDRHKSREVTLNDPNELRSCPRSFQHLIRERDSAQLRPSLSNTTAKLGVQTRRFGPSLGSNCPRAVPKLDPNWSLAAEALRQLWGQSRPKSSKRRPIVLEVGQMLAERGQHAPRMPNLSRIGRIWAKPPLYKP